MSQTTVLQILILKPYTLAEIEPTIFCSKIVTVAKRSPFCHHE
jgi:hypothetical protein